MKIKLLILVFIASISFSAEAKKILVLYSSINEGHIRTAETLRTLVAEESSQQDEIVLQDIREFQPGLFRWLDQQLYSLVVRKFPKTYDRFYRHFMSTREQSMSLADVKSGFNETSIEAFIQRTKPDVILATHYGAAQALGNIRERGGLRNVVLGWLNTESITGFFPRLSMRFDKTFQPSPQAEQNWINRGVPADKVTSANLSAQMPIEDQARAQIFAARSLDPAVTTLAFSLGEAANAKQYQEMLSGLTHAKLGSAQILIKQPAGSKIVESLRANNSNLKLIEIDPAKPADLQIWNAADVLVGTVPDLQESMNKFKVKPMLAVQVRTALDRDNASAMQTEGLALVNNKLKEVGADLQRILTNEVVQEKMRKAQMDFGNGVNLYKIKEFIRNAKPNAVENFALGIEGGTSVSGTDMAIARLDRDAPADVEILLAYGKYPNGKFFTNDGNPFGHIAIRIGEDVYTVNGKAEHGVEARGIHKTTLKDYMYGIDRTYKNEEHTDTFGEAYARHNLSIRVAGVDRKNIQAMLNELQRLETTWQNGEWVWKGRENNCADFVEKVLRAGNFITPDQEAANGRVHKITFPLDVFDRYLDYFEKNQQYRVELVGYTYVPDSKNLYRRTTFPLSIYQPARLIRNMLQSNVRFEESKVTKRLVVAPNDDRVTYENLDSSSVAAQKKAVEEGAESLRREYSELLAEEAKVENMRTALERDGMTSQQIYDRIGQGFSKFSAAEMALITAGKTLPDATRESMARELRAEIDRWSREQSEYQKELDILIVKQLDYFAKKILLYVNSTLGDLQHRISAKDFETLNSWKNKADLAYQKYLEFKPQYGKAKDIPRTEAYRMVFEHSRSFIEASDAIMATNKVKLTFLERFKEKGLSMKKFVAYLKATGRATKLLGTLIAGNRRSMKYLKQGNDLVRGFAQDFHYDVSVVGRENLENLSRDPKTVNIVAPIHRNPVLDMVAFSALNVNDTLPFIFIPRPAAQHVAKNLSNVIVVGGGSDLPIEQAITELKKGYTQNLLLYPEGSVAAGMMETRPPREKFTWGLVQRLRSEGYKVNIVPVTYMNTARFAFDNTINPTIAEMTKNTAPVTLDVVVGRPINTDMIDVMMKQNHQNLNWFIRATWLETMTSDIDLLGGQLRPEAMRKIVDDRLIKRNSGGGGAAIMCKDLFSTGVAL